VDLLRETQRAAAPEQMIQWHEQLKLLRTDEKGLEAQQQEEGIHLKNLQAKQNATREDVDRFNQRQELVAKSQLIEKCRPIISMRILGAEVRQLKSDLRASKQELEQYQAEVGPAQVAQQAMETYRDQVDKVAKVRKERFDAGKTRVELLASRIDTEQQSLSGFSAEIDAEKQADKKRKLEMKRIEGDISRLKTAQNSNMVEYDHDMFESRKAEYRSQYFAAERQALEIMDKVKSIRDDVNNRRLRLEQKASARNALNTQSGQQGNLLKKMSADTHQAWEWLAANMTSLGLKDKAYPPPILSCSIPDSQYANVVESQLRLSDFTAITCTNNEDAKTVSNKLLGRKEEGCLQLHNITIRTCPNPRAYYHSPLTAEELTEIGFDGWISDYIQGPDPVLAMLCESTKLHRAAYASRPLSNEQYNTVLRKNLSKFVSGNEIYQIITRREYNASSTSVSQLRNAQFFTDQPVDTEEKRRLDDAMKELQHDIELQKAEHQLAITKLAEVRGEQKEADEQKV
jgi:hypothetical protein